MKACEELKKKICKLGAEMMEVDEGKVDFDGSCVFYDETLEISDGADGNAAGHMTDAEEAIVLIWMPSVLKMPRRKFHWKILH